MSAAKPFAISKREVWEAYKKVRANKGAAGVDEQSIELFERKLSGNLYKLWNRLSSGAYFPPPVRAVAIPKKGGGERILGIPTVEDRVAQTVVANRLGPLAEQVFHPDSFAYRPGKSAHQALASARQRCWRRDWVVDLDIKGFFDNLDHELTLRAVRKVTDCRWILLYVERWLKAPLKQQDGTMVERSQGTPQGGVVSPVIANLFLHFALDDWLHKTQPDVLFERYADDQIVHCRSEKQAHYIRQAIKHRLERCKLELNEQKTRIVYCKDDDRPGSYPNESFDFLGYTFRPRRSKNRHGKFFINFTPAVSRQAVVAMRRTLRRWRVHLRSDKSLDDLAQMLDPLIRGWIGYYGKFYKSELYVVFEHLNRTLVRWAQRKYKRLRRHRRRAEHWLGRIARRQPNLFAHWKLLGLRPAAG